MRCTGFFLLPCVRLCGVELGFNRVVCDMSMLFASLPSWMWTATSRYGTGSIFSSPRSGGREPGRIPILRNARMRWHVCLTRSPNMCTNMQHVLYYKLKANPIDKLVNLGLLYRRLALRSPHFPGKTHLLCVVFPPIKALRECDICFVVEIAAKSSWLFLKRPTFHLSYTC